MPATETKTTQLVLCQDRLVLLADKDAEGLTLVIRHFPRGCLASTGPPKRSGPNSRFHSPQGEPHFGNHSSGPGTCPLFFAASMKKVPSSLTFLLWPGRVLWRSFVQAQMDWRAGPCMRKRMRKRLLTSWANVSQARSHLTPSICQYAYAKSVCQC